MASTANGGAGGGGGGGGARRKLARAPDFVRIRRTKRGVVEIRILRKPTTKEVRDYLRWYRRLYRFYEEEGHKFILSFDLRDVEKPDIGIMIAKLELTIKLEPRTVHQIKGSVVLAHESRADFVKLLRNIMFQRDVPAPRFLTCSKEEAEAKIAEHLVGAPQPLPEGWMEDNNIGYLESEGSDDDTSEGSDDEGGGDA